MPSARVSFRRPPVCQRSLARADRVDLFGDLQILLLAQREVGADGIDLRHRREQGRRSDEISDLRSGDAGDAVEERPHLREAHVQARGLDRGLRRLDRGVCRELRLDIVVQLTLRDGALLGERRIALDIALSPTELRARFCELRLGLCQRDGEGARIDFKEHFVLADHRALAVVPLHQVTRHLRPDLAVGVTVEGRDPLAGDLDRLGHHLESPRPWAVVPRPMRAPLRSLCSPRPGG